MKLCKNCRLDAVKCICKAVSKFFDSLRHIPKTKQLTAKLSAK